MYKKVIIATVLIAFTGVQIASSLQCLTCTTPGECENPIIETCTNRTANATSQALSIYYTNVPNVTGSQHFRCVRDEYKFFGNHSISMAVHGCVHPEAQACYLTLRPDLAIGNQIHDCYSCDWKLCNPAGTFSNSFYTIFGSIVALVLAKIFAK